MRNRMRSIATTRNAPTPTDTAPTITPLLMDGTCSASTCRSGSDMVIMLPTRKHMSSISQNRLVFVVSEPTYCPMGIMARSAPSVNRPIPAISNSAPTTYAASTPFGTGTMVKQRTKTMAAIGNIDVSASRHCSSSIVLFLFMHPPHLFTSIAHYTKKDKQRPY